MPQLAVKRTMLPKNIIGSSTQLTSRTIKPSIASGYGKYDGGSRSQRSVEPPFQVYPPPPPLIGT